VPEHQKLKPFG